MLQPGSMLRPLLALRGREGEQNRARNLAYHFILSKQDSNFVCGEVS